MGNRLDIGNGLRIVKTLPGFPNTFIIYAMKTENALPKPDKVEDDI